MIGLPLGGSTGSHCTTALSGSTSGPPSCGATSSGPAGTSWRQRRGADEVARHRCPLRGTGTCLPGSARETPRTAPPRSSARRSRGTARFRPAWPKLPRVSDSNSSRPFGSVISIHFHGSESRNTWTPASPSVSFTSIFIRASLNSTGSPSSSSRSRSAPLHSIPRPVPPCAIDNDFQPSHVSEHRISPFKVARYGCGNGVRIAHRSCRRTSCTELPVILVALPRMNPTPARVVLAT